MKKILLLLAVISLFSCKKKEPDQALLEQARRYIIVGTDKGSIRFNKINNPTPIIDTIRIPNDPDSVFVVEEYYEFDFNAEYGALRVSRFKSYGKRNSGIKTTDNFIRIECYYTLAEGVLDKITRSESTNGDTVFWLSENSKLTDLANIKEIRMVSNYFPIAFSLGDSIAITSNDARWRSRFQTNIESEGSKDFTFFHHRKYESTGKKDTNTVYNLSDLYYPIWAGLKEKYMVFNYTRDNDSDLILDKIRLAKSFNWK